LNEKPDAVLVPEGGCLDGWIFPSNTRMNDWLLVWPVVVADFLMCAGYDS
jgi:hypothetical protein